jgi:hypothetical protein
LYSLLEKIKDGMQKIVFASRLSRFLHLNRNESLLKGFKTQLDDAYRDFLVRHFEHNSASQRSSATQAASTLRLEVQQAQIAIRQRKFELLVQGQLEFLNLIFHSDASNKAYLRPHPQLNTSSLFYSIGFFGRPLMLPYKWHTPPFLHDTHKPELAGLRARGHNRPTLLSLRLCMGHLFFRLRVGPSFMQPVKHPTQFSRLKLMSL